jgi:hypothetical protein
MTEFEKVIIIDTKEAPPKSLTEILKRIFLTIISLALIIGIFYLDILTSIVLLIIFISFGIASFLVMKFKKKKKYYKMN